MSEFADAPQIRAIMDLASDIAPETVNGDVYAEIKTLLERPKDGLRIDELFKLRRVATLAVLEGSMPEQAHTALYVICDAMRQVPWLSPLEETAAWKRAMRLALSAADRWDIGKHSREIFSREQAVVAAFKRLENRGYDYKLTDQGLVLETKAFRRLTERIDKIVLQLGGIGVIRNVLMMQSRLQRHFDGAFLCGRNLQQIPAPRMPSMPWHYLLQLGIKHLRQQPRSRSAEDDWALLLELSRDLCATFDVEPYSSLEGLEIVASGLQDSLQDLVLYDEIFGFHQWQPKHAKALLDSWLSEMGPRGFEVSGGAATWQAMTAALMTAATDVQCKIITPDSLGPAVPEAAALLRRLAKGSREANRVYVTPLDAAKRTSLYFPIYEVAKDQYMLLPRAFLARAMYEWLYKELREAAAPKLETAMGEALERLVELAVAQTAHVRLIAGRKYRSKTLKKELEVDLIAESADRIFLIECKKKALTNAARGGQPLYTLVDLTASLFAMLLQLARHETELQRNGKIVFIDGTVLECQGREIEKIAVTPLDYGSLQDRLFIGSIMRGLFGQQVSTKSQPHQDHVSKINRVLADLSRQVTELANETAAGDINHVLHDSAIETWWLSIDMLQYLCGENGNLWAALRPLRHLSFRTGHLMTEIAYARKAKLPLTELPKNLGHQLVDPPRRR